MLSERQKTKILSAYKSKTLKVRSLSPQGEIEWKPITQVHRANTSQETILEVSTSRGASMVVTGGHRIYTDPVTKVEADTLTQGSVVQGGSKSLPYFKRVSKVKRLPSRRYMYDVTVQDNHNLLLHNSGVFVSNCPDRNYHFRPPTSEGTINQFNRVFAYIWTDEELIEYMERGVDFINLWPPETGYNTIDAMVGGKPAWRQMILMAAIAHATMALSLNWIADEFDYSIGGVSLSIEKSSKYEGIKNNAESQLDKMLEAKTRTTKIIRGLQQSRYGLGVRSSFGGPYGNGILTPRKYLGFNTSGLT